MVTCWVGLELAAYPTRLRAAGKGLNPGSLWPFSPIPDPTPALHSLPKGPSHGDQVCLPFFLAMSGLSRGAQALFPATGRVLCPQPRIEPTSPLPHWKLGS